MSYWPEGMTWRDYADECPHPDCPLPEPDCDDPEHEHEES